MSGAVAAHAAYNGSGTQGLAVTNKIQGNDGDVMSVFWNKNDTTRQLLYGSAFVEIPSSSGSGSSALSRANTQVFEVNNDIDCLGNLILKVQVDGVVGAAVSAPGNATLALTGSFATTGLVTITATTATPFLASMVGSQISVVGGGGTGVITAYSSTTVVTAFLTTAIAVTVAAALTITGVGFVEPLSAATIIDRIEFWVGTQTWQILEKVDILALATTELHESSYADFVIQSSGGYSNTLTLNNASVGISSGSVNTYFTALNGGGITAYIPLKILTKTLSPQLENVSEHTESGYLMAAAPNQQVKIKIYTSTRGTGDFTTALSANTSFGDTEFANATINLGLFAQQHVMCNEERDQMLAMPSGLPRRVKITQNVQQSFAASASSPFNIVLDTFSLYASHLIISIPNNLLSAATYASDASTVELLLNSSSFSGALPFGLLSIIPSSIGLYNNNYITDATSQNPYEVFVFPLASRAYGGSGVPLNRFDNIILRIKTSAATVVTGSIYVTCVGETTALYKGGAASLAMY